MDILKIILADANFESNFNLVQKCLLNIPFELYFFKEAINAWKTAIKESEHDLLIARFILLSF